MTANVRLWVGLAVLVLVIAGVQWLIGWSQLLMLWRFISPAALVSAALLTLGSLSLIHI